MATALLPRNALIDEGDATLDLPVCDHCCGTEERMRKALALQAELGPVFDITLDCEDGAPVGAEAAHVRMVAELALSANNRFGRVGARVHPVDHPAFTDDVDTLVGRAGDRLAHLKLPKPRHLADLQQAIAQIDYSARLHGRGATLPVHAAWGKPMARCAMCLRWPRCRAAACHAATKVPSHCVVTEFKDQRAIDAKAHRAAREFGYLRMWGIHPAQIRLIVEAFAPSIAEVDEAIKIIRAVQAAQAADWAPIRHRLRGHQDGGKHHRRALAGSACRASATSPHNAASTASYRPAPGRVLGRLGRLSVLGGLGRASRRRRHQTGSVRLRNQARASPSTFGANRARTVAW